MALFAFTTLERLERECRNNREAKRRCVALSIESGVLCDYTAFVGFSEKIYRCRFDAPFAYSPDMIPSIQCMCSGEAFWRDECSGAAAAPRASRHLFRRVVDGQDFGGWWTNVSVLSELVSGNIPDFPGVPEQVAATVVALAILRKMCSADEAAWKLIERKAVGWLQGQGTDYEPLICQVMASLVG